MAQQDEYWKLSVDGRIITAWKNDTPSFVRRMLLLQGLKKTFATMDEYEKYRPRRKSRQKQIRVELSLPGWPPEKEAEMAQGEAQ